MDKKYAKISLIRLILVICLFGLSLVGCTTLGSRRARFIKTHPPLSIDMKKAIRSGELVMGMTKEMVLLSLGKPDSRYSYQHTQKIIETWTYYGGLFGRDSYVKFEDGKVVGWSLQ